MSRIKYQEAAGLEMKRGRPPAGPAPSKADLARLYIKARLSPRDTAAALGVSKDGIRRALVGESMMMTILVVCHQLSR